MRKRKLNKQNEGLKIYLSLVQQELKLNDERMKEIEKQVEYLDNKISEALENYPNGEIDIISFQIFISYVLINIIDDRDILEAFTKFLMKMFDITRETS